MTQFEDLNDVIQNCRTRIDMVEKICNNGVVYNETQPIYRLLSAVSTHYNQLIAGFHNQAQQDIFYIPQISSGLNSYESVKNALMKHHVTYNGVELWTKLKHVSTTVQRTPEWDDPQYNTGLCFMDWHSVEKFSSYLLDSYSNVSRKMYRTTPSFNGKSILIKSDLSVDEWEYIINYFTLVDESVTRAITCMFSWYVFPTSRYGEYVGLDVESKIFARGVRLNSMSTKFGSYNQIVKNPDEFITLGVDYINEICKYTPTGCNMATILALFDELPLLVNTDQYTVGTCDLKTYLTSNKRIDTYDNAIACNKLVNDIATEIMNQTKHLGLDYGEGV